MMCSTSSVSGVEGEMLRQLGQPLLGCQRQ
jgi:hypothetical protein